MTSDSPTPSGDSSEFSHSFRESQFYLMVSLLLRNGMRLGEVLNLKAEDIDLKQRVLTIASRKTGTTRHIAILPELHGILTSYLKERATARLSAMKRLDRLRRLRRLH